MHTSLYNDASSIMATYHSAGKSPGELPDQEIYIAMTPIVLNQTPSTE